MKKKFFLLIAVLSILFLSGCEQNIKTPKFKLTLIQPENGSIQVRPSFPSDGMIEKGSELTFTLSANSGYKVKTLTIDGTAYSDITDNRITKKIKIEKNTEVSGAAEEDTENPPAPLTKYKVTVTQPANGNIQVTPALPSNGMVENGKELTFTLSANTGFKVKTLTIGGTTYSNITDKRITKKVKIEKNTEVSGAVEEDTENPPAPLTKYKVTVTQPANGKIEVTPALPTDETVENGKELTFTLSANSGYKVKALTIDGTIYSDVTDNRITKTVKIEKDTAVSGAAEAETGLPAEEMTIGNSIINVTKDESGNIIKASGTIRLNEIEELAGKSTNNIVINTDALTIKSFDDKGVIGITENNLQAVINKLSVLNIENQDFTKQSITLNIENNKLKITSITGNISLQDIIDNNEETTEIAKYIAKNLKENSDTNFDSSNLTINTFYKKTTGKGAPSRDSSQTNPEYTYESTPITPKFLKETKLNALNKAVLNFKDSNEVMHVKFESYQGETEEQKQSDYFDITEFYNEIENGKLKNIPSKVEGNIFLRGERDPDLHGTEDHTKYAKTTELLSLLNNPKIKHKITVGKVQLRGNVKDLLPLLVGPNKIKEADGGITFGQAYDTPCTGENWTGYNGIVNDDGNVNNTGRSILKAEEFLELKKRSGEKQAYVRNAIITDLDSKNLSPEQLENTQFYRDILTNVKFKNSDLSKIQMKTIFAGTGKLEFEDTTLPQILSNSSIGTLILKNVTFPKEEFYETGTFEDLPYAAPDIGTLTIYGEIKNSPLKDLTQEQIEKLKNDPQRPEEMPSIYKGSQEIYDRLKYIYRGESHIKEFGNFQGSIQKQQNQLLALLQTQNKSRG